MTDPKFWSFLGANVEHALLEAMNEQDRAAIDAFVALCALYKVLSSLDQKEALAAMRLVSSCMQAGTRRVCRWGIAYVLDWGDVDRVWNLVESAPSGDQLAKMLEGAQTKAKWIVVDEKGRPAAAATLSKPKRRRSRA